MDVQVNVVELWLPILLAAGAVFIASAAAWMVLPHHRKDWGKAESEDALLDLVREGIKPGQYMFPYCSNKEWKDPEAVKRWKAGPHGTMAVWGGPGSMPGNMVKSFIVYVVVGLFVGYVAAFGRPAGSEFMDVFRVTGAAAIGMYCLGFLPGAIWFRGTLRSTVMSLIDGIVYGVITGLIFGWLWPAVEVATPALPTVGG